MYEPQVSPSNSVVNLQETEGKHTNQPNSLRQGQLQFPHGRNRLNKQEQIGRHVENKLIESV